MIKKIEQIEAELKALKESINAESRKPEFEVGKWYRDGQWLLFITEIENEDKVKGYGFKNNDWYDNRNSSCYCGHTYDSWIPATPEEVKKALIAEAENRGFKKGVKLKQSGINHYANFIECCAINGEFDYFEFSDTLNSNNVNGYIYKQGQWASIIKDEVITICGKEVEFGKDKIFINDIVYGKNNLEHLKYLFELGQIKSLNVGCSGQEKVTLETINKILDRLK